MNENAISIRRARISNFVDENKTIGFDQAKLISEELGINYDTVKNDVRWLKKEYEDRFKKYNLEGFRKRALEKLERLEKLQLLVQDIIKDSKTDTEQKMKAIHLETEIMNDQFHLESDGITIIQDELDQREEARENKKDEVGNKAN